ncbi:Hypothetical predicted protein [Lecanosticta acicola]|uniref:Uncharacterized protein n=1 Tax=Lecanosticta acicola TaxID=111012 RepID=A0AAI8Z8X9_9PEZI|nr:Hypothetical predicted protein [Lecanosticta acicola]
MKSFKPIVLALWVGSAFALPASNLTAPSYNESSNSSGTFENEALVTRASRRSDIEMPDVLSQHSPGQGQHHTLPPLTDAEFRALERRGAEFYDFMSIPQTSQLDKAMRQKHRLQSDQGSQSKFTKPEQDLKRGGWITVPGKKTGRLDDRNINLPAPVCHILESLGLDCRTRAAGGYNDVVAMHQGNSEFDGEQHDAGTGAFVFAVYNTKEGVLISASAESPKHAIKDTFYDSDSDYDDEEAQGYMQDPKNFPKLQKISDIWFLCYLQHATQNGDDPRNLRYAIGLSIHNDDAVRLHDYIMKQKGARPQPWSKETGRSSNANIHGGTYQTPLFNNRLTFAAKSNKEDRAIFHALIYRWNSLAWMLLQHRAELGVKRVSKISLFHVPDKEHPEYTGSSSIYELVNLDNSGKLGPFVDLEGPDADVEAHQPSAPRRSTAYKQGLFFLLGLAVVLVLCCCASRNRSSYLTKAEQESRLNDLNALDDNLQLLSLDQNLTVEELPVPLDLERRAYHPNYGGYASNQQSGGIGAGMPPPRNVSQRAPPPPHPDLVNTFTKGEELKAQLRINYADANIQYADLMNPNKGWTGVDLSVAYMQTELRPIERALGDLGISINDPRLRGRRWRQDQKWDRVDNHHPTQGQYTIIYAPGQKLTMIVIYNLTPYAMWQRMNGANARMAPGIAPPFAALGDVAAVQWTQFSSMMGTDPRDLGRMIFFNHAIDAQTRWLMESVLKNPGSTSNYGRLSLSQLPVWEHDPRRRFQLASQTIGATILIGSSVGEQVTDAFMHHRGKLSRGHKVIQQAEMFKGDDSTKVQPVLMFELLG